MLRLEKAQLAPTSCRASSFQTHRADLVTVPPESAPLPPNQELGRPGRLGASVPSPPRREGVSRGMATAPSPSGPSSPRETGAPLPPQPDTHQPVPQPPRRVPTYRHRPYSGPPPQPPAAYPRGFRGTGRNHFRRVTAAFCNAREIGTWQGEDTLCKQLASVGSALLF